MIRHVVMWRLRPSAEGRPKTENARLICEALRGLVGKVPEILHLEVGSDVLGDPSSWDVYLVVDFEDLEALRRYQDHPEHRRVAEFVTRVREERATVDCPF